MKVPNPFRTKANRAAFDEMVRAYVNKSRALFLPSGERCTGNGAAMIFWRGFDGVRVGGGFTDRASRECASYVHYRAGQVCRARQERSRC